MFYLAIWTDDDDDDDDDAGGGAGGGAERALADHAGITLPDHHFLPAHTHTLYKHTHTHTQTHTVGLDADANLREGSSLPVGMRGVVRSEL